MGRRVTPAAGGSDAVTASLLNTDVLGLATIKTANVSTEGNADRGTADSSATVADVGHVISGLVEERPRHGARAADTVAVKAEDAFGGLVGSHDGSGAIDEQHPVVKAGHHRPVDLKLDRRPAVRHTHPQRLSTRRPNT